MRRAWPNHLLAAAAVLLFPAVGAYCQKTPEYRRIIAINPSLVETVYELGGQDRLVGISAYADYPPQAKRDKVSIGGIVNLDVERLISLESDLVISAPSVSAREKLVGLGIRFEFIPDDTLKDVQNSFRRVGELVGKSEAGKALAEKLVKAVDAAAKRSSRRPKVKCLAVIGYEPMWVVGGVGFLHELIEAAGGENVAGSIKKDFYGIDLERVLAARPDVILDITYEKSSAKAHEKKVRALWRKFPGIPAVKNGRIEFVESDLLTIPGPRLVEGLKALERALGAAETQGDKPSAPEQVGAGGRGGGDGR